jgi:hypothetical protein
MELTHTESTLDYGSEVMKRLPQAIMLHLACHGIQDDGFPLKSAFRLGEGRIELREILQLKLDNAFLAFLSACETVKGFAVLRDEVFHLGSAMLYAGFRSVIGTMWYDIDERSFRKPVPQAYSRIGLWEMWTGRPLRIISTKSCLRTMSSSSTTSLMPLMPPFSVCEVKGLHQIDGLPSFIWEHDWSNSHRVTPGSNEWMYYERRRYVRNLAGDSSVNTMPSTQEP